MSAVDATTRAPVLDVPTAIEPEEDAVLGSRKPRFTWKLPSGADGAVVEICRDRECEQVVEQFVAVDSGAPNRALPSTPLFYRVVATQRGLRATTSPVRRFELHVTSVLHGAHVDLTIPYDTMSLGKSLVALADHAFERYADWLGVAVPPGRCSVELLLPLAFDDAVEHHGGLSIDTIGFTDAATQSTASSSVLFELGSARTDEPLPGRLEGVTLQELYQCMRRLVRPASAGREPWWWSTASGELFAARVLSESFSISRDRLVLTTNRVRWAQGLLLRGWLPLYRLFDAEEPARYLSNVLRTEAVALFNFLDTSSRYHARLVAFLRTPFSAEQARSSFDNFFNDLDTLEADLRESLPVADVLRFRLTSGELRPFGRTGFALDCVGSCLAVAQGSDGTPADKSAGDEIVILLSRRAGDAKQVLVTFGARGLRQYEVRLSEGALPQVQRTEQRHHVQGRAILWTETIRKDVASTAARPVRLGAFTVGATPRLRLSLKDDSVEVAIDGQVVFSGALPQGAVEGGWGVGTKNGSIHFDVIEPVAAP